MSILMLLFHSDFAKSQANRVLVDALTPRGDVEVIDMYALYPSGEIDLDAEVARLIAAERLILQFPVNWYAPPPLVQAWQNSVLTRMFYIHAQDEGERIRGLPLLVAATAGNTPDAYAPEGMNLFSLEELHKPLHSTAHRCAMTWSDPFLVYGANRSTPEVLAEAGLRYAARVADWASGPR